MHPSARKVASSAVALGLNIEVVEFDETTRTAADAASAVGCGIGQIVKSLLFVVDGHPVMALVSGSNRLDESKLASLCHVSRKRIKRADAEFVKSVTGYSIGGVPPFGHASELPVFVDSDLLEFELVWAAAGTPHAVFAISPTDLVEVSKGVVADIRLD
jgi:Cys-tRNA(Pro) deacylase